MRVLDFGERELEKAHKVQTDHRMRKTVVLFWTNNI